MTNIIHSSCKLHEKPSPMAMSASNTPLLLSSLVHSSLRASIRNENTLMIIGSHSLPPCTNLCTALSRHYTLVSQARRISLFASSLHAAKWQIKTASRKSHMSSLLKLLQYTKRLLVIQERNSKLFALLQVDCIRHETLERRTTTLLSRSVHYTVVSYLRSQTSVVLSTWPVTCGGQQKSGRWARRTLNP